MTRAWMTAAAALAAASAVQEPAIREDRPALVYSEDPADPWNRIHHLLFTRRLKITLADMRGAAPARREERLEGGDLPAFMILEGAEYLLEEPRHGRLVRALEAELAAPSAAGRTLEARVAFQQDLWNRFDAVHQLLGSKPPRAEESRALRLRALLGRAIAGAAATASELRAIPSRFDAAARAFPEALDPGLFAPGSGWREIVSTFGDGPVEADTTVHAKSAGYRIVFRRFVKVPESARGLGCLAEATGPDRDPQGERCTDQTLPEGTRSLLLETALAVARGGDLVPVPLIVGAQSRTVASPGEFHVLHASRAALARSTLDAGGVLALTPDALIPMTASAFRRTSGQGLVPLKQSCPLCHGPGGQVLGTGSKISRPRSQLLPPDNAVEQERVMRAKRKDASYPALVEALAAP